MFYDCHCLDFWSHFLVLVKIRMNLFATVSLFPIVLQHLNRTKNDTTLGPSRWVTWAIIRTTSRGINVISLSLNDSFLLKCLTDLVDQCKIEFFKYKWMQFWYQKLEWVCIFLNVNKEEGSLIQISIYSIINNIWTNQFHNNTQQPSLMSWKKEKNLTSSIFNI